MSPEAQRIKIAEACGWMLSSPNLEYKWLNPDTKWSEPELPDYLNDLNAMREAEGTLNSNQWEAWHRIASCDFLTDEQPWFVRLTSAQRAEIFLRTIGKWEDDK